MELIAAVEMGGDLKRVRELIGSRVYLDAKEEKSGATPLTLAARFGKIGVLRMLIDAGADVNLKGLNHETPIAHVFMFGRRSYKCARLLLNAGANINDKTTKDVTILMHAIGAERVEDIKFLLENGADPNVVSYSSGPLVMAIKKDMYSVVNLLLEHNADPNKQCPSGKTPLSTAISHGRGSYVPQLVKYGANLDCHVKHGRTPLVKCIERECTPLFRELLLLGADTNFKDRSGLLPVDIAIVLNREEYVLALLNNGSRSPWLKVEGHDAIAAMIEEFPKIVTLRTLCLRVVKKNKVDTSSLPFPALFEWPDEFEVKQVECATKRKRKVYFGRRTATAKKQK